MKSGDKAGSRNDSYCKGCLPQMSVQDKRVFFSNIGKENTPHTKVLLCIPLPEDIFTSDGKKKLENLACTQIEQIQISSIRSDDLLHPSQLSIMPVKHDEFEEMDQKVKESERIALKIQKEFEELGISPPIDPIDVEPLFGEYIEREPSVMSETSMSSSTARERSTFSQVRIIENKEGSGRSTLERISNAEKVLNKCLIQTKRDSHRPVRLSPKLSQLNLEKLNEYVSEDF